MNKMKHKLISILIVLAIIPFIMGATYAPDNTWTEKQELAHEIAEIARSMGLSEDHTIIVEAQKLFSKEGQSEQISYYTDEDAVMIAKTLRKECYGMKSTTEMACVAWCILNRVDAEYGTISDVVTAKHQFAYRSDTEAIDPYLSVAYDVLDRWQSEHNGEIEVGRVLPLEYIYFSGNGKHNFFRAEYDTSSPKWDYSLTSPYAD